MPNAERVAQLLAELRSVPKFGPVIGGLYTGIRDISERNAAEAAINDLIDQIASNLAPTFADEAVLEAFGATLGGLDLFDTEDRERACEYLEAIMEIVGVESSNGLLMNWMYGFAPEKD